MASLELTIKVDRLRKLTWRVRNIIEAYRPFTQNEWIFACDRVLAMKASLSAKDAELFNVDAKEVVWERLALCYEYILR